MEFDDASLAVHLFGEVELDAILALQQRLALEELGAPSGRITVLVGEHARCLSLGRLGSRGHVHLSPAALASERIDIRWVNRGGGAVLHLPGQLFVYAVANLPWHGWSVGNYLQRLLAAVSGTLAEIGATPRVGPELASLWGRTGPLAALGISVRGGVTSHGAFINVDPPLRLYRAVECLGGESLSSLAAERQGSVKMSAVRASLPGRLAAAFGVERQHMHTGHPLLRGGG